MLVRNKQGAANGDPMFNVYLNGKQLEKVNSIRYLGVEVNSYLQWTQMYSHYVYGLLVKYSW